MVTGLEDTGLISMSVLYPLIETPFCKTIQMLLFLPFKQQCGAMETIQLKASETSPMCFFSMFEPQPHVT